jgi:CDGSH-type Zn-finger protein
MIVSIALEEESMADITVKCIPNGPYRVNGPFQIADPKGNVVSIAEGQKVSLCRCGGSANKPYCDGTHGRIGFQADEPFVPKA